MKKFAFLSLAALLLSACTFVTPYQIVFTTPGGAELDPALDTLDFALNNPALGYISAIHCEDSPAFEILPVKQANMNLQLAHNLSLELLEDEEPGTVCEVTVTAYSESTASSSSARIEIVVGGPGGGVVMEDETPEEEAMETEEGEEVETEDLDASEDPESASNEGPESGSETLESPETSVKGDSVEVQNEQDASLESAESSEELDSGAEPTQTDDTTQNNESTETSPAPES